MPDSGLGTDDLLLIGGAGAALLGLIAFLLSYALSPERAQSLAVVIEGIAGVLPGSWKKGALDFAAKLNETAEKQIQERKAKREAEGKDGKEGRDVEKEAGVELARVAKAAAETVQAQQVVDGVKDAALSATSGIRRPSRMDRLRDAIPTVRIVAGEDATNA